VLLTSLNVRHGVRTALLREYIAEVIVTIPIFLVVGFAVSWFAAASFLFGLVLVVLRGASALAVLVMSLSVFSVSLCYLLFRDLRGLLGFIGGISSITLISRLHSGIFFAASDMVSKEITPPTGSAAQNNNKMNNPAKFVVQVGRYIGGALAPMLNHLESFSAAIVVSAMSASFLPYISDNKYATCVYNNVHLDYDCFAHRNTIPVTYAAQICAQNNYYLQFPALSFSQSNSIFVVVPFLVAMLGVLIVAICTLPILPRLSDTQETESQVEVEFAVCQYIKMRRFTAGILFFAGCYAISYGFFGRQSSFQKAFSGNNLPRREFTSDIFPDKCIPPTSVSGIRESLPTLRDTLGTYKATDEFGNTFPVPTEIPWRMLLVLLLGMGLGLVLEGIMRFFTDTDYIPASAVMAMGETGTVEIITQGLGTGLTSTTVPFMVVLAVALAAHHLLGGYGVALLAVSMLSSSGVPFVISAFEALANNANGISDICTTRRGKRPPSESSSSVSSSIIAVFESIGSYFEQTLSTIYAACGLLVTIAFTSDLLLVSSLFPTAKDVIGGINTQPLRHIRSGVALSAINPSVVVSVIFGILLPVSFIALPILGMARTSSMMLVEENKFKRSQTNRRNENDGDNVSTNNDGDAEEDESEAIQGWVHRIAKHSLFEAVIPTVMTFAAPLSIGFGLGQRALIGFLLAASGNAYLFSMLFITVGNTWKNVHRTLKKKTNVVVPSQSKWLHSAYVANSIGEFLCRINTPSLSIFMKHISMITIFSVSLMSVDHSKWYIGFSILIAAIILAIIALVLGHRHQKKIQALLKSHGRRVDIQRRTIDRGEDNSGSRIVRASPFYEDNVVVSRRNLIPENSRRFVDNQSFNDGMESIPKSGKDD